MESVNTCPENYQWSPAELPSTIQVEAAGLYELTLAFFTKQQESTVKIIVNDDCVITKTIANDDYGPLKKVCAIEFVVLPGKAKISVVFECAES